MLLPAAATIRPGHDNTSALLLARLTVSLADAVAAGLVYCAARQLTAMPGALLGALVYAADGRAIEFSRQVLLEPLQAPWLAGGAALLLAQMNRRERQWKLGLLAGLLLAVGISIKLTGAVVPLAAFLALAAARRWRLLGDAAVGVALGALVICGWSLAVSGDEIVRQTVLLQAARRTSLVFDHWAWLMGDYTAGFTAFLTWMGALAIVLNAWRGRIASGWISRAALAGAGVSPVRPRAELLPPLL